VQLERPSGHAIISGRIATNYIRISPETKVKVEMTPYDLTKGGSRTA